MHDWIGRVGRSVSTIWLHDRFGRQHRLKFFVMFAASAAGARHKFILYQFAISLFVLSICIMKLMQSLSKPLNSLF